MPSKTCIVSFTDVRRIRHAVEVHAESLYEAVVLGLTVLRSDPWFDRMGEGTVLEIQAREPTVKHAISLQQVERWLDGATTSPNELMKKKQLKAKLSNPL